MRTEQWRAAWDLYRDDVDSQTGIDPLVAENLRELRSAEQSTEETVLVEDAARALPKSIGNYHILRRLDEGGMGLVLEAQQDQPRRRVALKIIRPGLASRDLLRRFEIEAEALGRLHHPGIAQIFEAGTADHGFGPQPFFAMEFIEGLPLMRHVSELEIPLRERLDLFARICDAINHAHERGIIHRDLKPGNILVDSTGQPKVLDFGVARVTDADANATRHTDVGLLIGTLAYMSPEQLLADPYAIDTRTDVYALGVLLYELLAGQLPYDTHGKTLPEAMRLIQQSEPPPLRLVDKRLSSDLETIAAKALDKDRERRYASAAALAADVRHYLQDEPISARPASAGYQLRKFALRHRGWVLGAAAVLLALMGGVFFSAREAIRASRAEQAAKQGERAVARERDRALAAERAALRDRDRAIAAENEALEGRNLALSERNRADQEAATARAVSDFLQYDLIAQSSSTSQSARGVADPDLRVRTALDRAAAKISERFGQQPRVEASLRATMGQTYYDLGLLPESRAQLEAAVRLRQTHLGPDHPDTLNTMHLLAMTLRTSGQYLGAQKLWTEVRRRRTVLLGPEHPDTLRAAQGLVAVHRNFSQYEEAMKLQHEILAARRRTLGDRHPDTLRSTNDLGLIYIQLGKAAEAEQLEATTAALRKEVLGAEHPDTLMSLHNLGLAQAENGNFPAAIASLTKALESQKRTLGAQHPSSLFTMGSLATTLQRAGQFTEAATLHLDALQVARQLKREDHPETLQNQTHLATLYLAMGRAGDAEKLFQATHDTERRVIGEDHPKTLLTLIRTATAAFQSGRQDAAVEMATRAMTKAGRLASDHRHVFDALTVLARVELQRGNAARAEEWLDRIATQRQRTLGTRHAETLEALDLLARARLAAGKFEAARVAAAAATDARTAKHRDSWQRFASQALLGASLAGLRQPAEAEALLVAAYHGLREREPVMPVPERAQIEQVRQWLEGVRRASGGANTAQTR